MGILNYKCTASVSQGSLVLAPLLGSSSGENGVYSEKKKIKEQERKNIGRSWVLWPLGFLNTGGEAESVVPVMEHLSSLWELNSAVLQHRKPHFELPGTEAGHSLVSSSQPSNSWSLAFWVKSLLPQMHFPSGGDRISLSGRHFK